MDTHCIQVLWQFLSSHKVNTTNAENICIKMKSFSFRHMLFKLKISLANTNMQDAPVFNIKRSVFYFWDQELFLILTAGPFLLI